MFKKFIILVLVIVLIVFFYYLHLINTPNSASQEIVNFVIEPGWGSIEIAKQLESQSLIKSKNTFIFYVWWKRVNNRLLSGEYELAKNLNIKEIAKILSGGEVIGKERKITIIEGWTAGDIGQYFEKEGMFQAEELLELVGQPGIDYSKHPEMPKPFDFSKVYEFLADKPKNYGLEGYLFPDTYRIYRDAELISIVRKMLDNFGEKLTPEMREQIKKNNMTIYQTITLASIIEKEVAQDADRRKVASIFYKRLNAGIPLQADSTVNFITGKNVTRSSLEDTQIDNPYNTYKYRGLPPGPICNPSLSAIKAAIYPDKNDYYYFLTTPEGDVIYSRTFEEHKANKAKYLD